MRKPVAYSAPYDASGLGQHFSCIVEETRSSQYLLRYYSLQPKFGDTLGQKVEVHPSYEEGFAYAPMAAIACGSRDRHSRYRYERAYSTRSKRLCRTHCLERSALTI